MRKSQSINGVVGKCGAVHAEHAQRERVQGVKRPDSHERGHHRTPKVVANSVSAPAALPLITPPPA